MVIYSGLRIKMGRGAESIGDRRQHDAAARYFQDSQS
jgi:hypothetical protein